MTDQPSQIVYSFIISSLFICISYSKINKVSFLQTCFSTQCEWKVNVDYAKHGPVFNVMYSKIYLLEIYGNSSILSICLGHLTISFLFLEHLNWACKEREAEINTFTNCLYHYSHPAGDCVELRSSIILRDSLQSLNQIPSSTNISSHPLTMHRSMKEDISWKQHILCCLQKLHRTTELEEIL